VDLIGALSHPSQQVKRLLDMAGNRPPEHPLPIVTTSSPIRTARQLFEPEVDQLVTAYQAGATAYQLNIHRITVGKHLRARGIDTRPPALNPDDLRQAAELYRQLWSLARIANKFQVATETIRTQLIEVGVEMRQPWER
jgi:hypothetical protein